MMRFVVVSGNQEIFDPRFCGKKKNFEKMALCNFLKPAKVNHQIHSNSSKIHVNTSIKMNKYNEWPLRKILDKLHVFSNGYK